MSLSSLTLILTRCLHFLDASCSRATDPRIESSRTAEASQWFSCTQRRCQTSKYRSTAITQLPTNVPLAGQEPNSCAQEDCAKKASGPVPFIQTEAEATIVNIYQHIILIFRRYTNGAFIGG